MEFGIQAGPFEVQLLITIAMLLGGLTFFLFGMSVMSGGLEKMAGGGLERTLRKITKNQLLGFVLGAGITIAVQSSSAMTVMLVGLVNSGIVAFADSFGIIMGSNVGTTLTAWLLSLSGLDDGGNFFLILLQPMTFAPLLAFIGIAMQMLSKKEKQHQLGAIFIGFAILMVGMELMSASMSEVRNWPAFQTLLKTMNSPILALLVSLTFTGIIQSSAATIAIVQALAASGAINLQMAIPLVLGANIGTCVTALISSVGTNKSAKRVAAMHIYVNTMGSIICMILLYIARIFAADTFMMIIPMWTVAFIHTIFNGANTLMLLPLRKPLIRLCELTIKSKPEKEHTAFLDERLFNNASLAISECSRLTAEMAEFARKSILASIELMTEFDEDKANFIRETETLTDKYEDKLSTYLVKLSNNELSESESHQVGRLLHSIGDLERIGDHALNILDVAIEIKEKNIIFSKNAIEEINTISNAVIEITNMSIDAFENDDFEAASHVEPLEQVIDNLRSELKSRHIERLQNGDCTVQLGFVFSDLLTNYERVSDHCSNLAVYTMQLDSDKLDAHKYLRSIKQDENSTFAKDFNNYTQKYSV